MSDTDISDIRERLARMEERQLAIHSMFQHSLANYGDLVNRVHSLEKLKSHFYLAAAVLGTLVSVGWELIKMKVFHRG
jgi:hypothetical protein